ncbi:MAG: aminodeoxychorismate synthase component I [Omnitrophica bacterium]|nr:aminodeoxychorismate synthase component I [Candidatus Omnitrophota bacterium]
MQFRNLPIIEKINLAETCVSVYSNFKEYPYSFFLDSALDNEKLGRFSFIGIEPFLVFKSKKDRITLDWITHREELRGNPFLSLKGLFERFKIDSHENFPIPFVGGGVGYFSYDLKNFNERLPDYATDDINIPDSVICFYDIILAFDHSNREYSIISTGFPERGKKRLYRQKARLENLKDKINHLMGCVYCADGAMAIPSEWRAQPIGQFPKSNFTKDAYIKTILKAKEYIEKGDIYQVNLSQRFKVDLDTDPFRLYETLRTINPAPFACFLNLGDIQIVSASPERFLKIDGRRIETRPIKGTRPRGRNPEEDRALKDELIASVKDRAENLMIIDLERNDLGRICEYGSVHVSEFMACEEYATVFHLVSTIEGKLRDEVTPIDCLINCFPGGSITGAPKIRAMEIIEELEPAKRSIYTGSVGYLSFNGNMDSSIIIRSFIIKGKKAFFQAGGGIVYDSEPEREYRETLDKAKALIEAISYESSVPKREVHSLR